MKEKFVRAGVAIAIWAVPIFAYAQGATIGTIMVQIQQLLNIAIPILITLALLYFIWGLAEFILASSDDDARKIGRDRMIHGVLGLFVIVAVWGLVAVVGRTFGVDSTSRLQGGQIPGVDNPYLR